MVRLVSSIIQSRFVIHMVSGLDGEGLIVLSLRLVLEQLVLFSCTVHTQGLQSKCMGIQRSTVWTRNFQGPLFLRTVDGSILSTDTLAALRSTQHSLGVPPLHSHTAMTASIDDALSHSVILISASTLHTTVSTTAAIPNPLPRPPNHRPNRSLNQIYSWRQSEPKQLLQTQLRQLQVAPQVLPAAHDLPLCST